VERLEIGQVRLRWSDRCEGAREFSGSRVRCEHVAVEGVVAGSAAVELSIVIVVGLTASVLGAVHTRVVPL